MSNQKDKLLEHEYDGIRELDNPLPGWWLLTFYGAIVFAVLYFMFYHFGGNGKNPWDILAQDLEDVKMQQLTAAPKSSGPGKAVLQAALANPDIKKHGEQIYGAKCASCHGGRGEGSIGPNLTDNYWLHKGEVSEIYHTIAEGVLDKGMPPWKTMLKPDELVAITAYVKSLQGTNPPNAKAPQGIEEKD